MSKLLIVVDMQNDFVDGSLGTKEAVAIVPFVCEQIQKEYDDIFCTRDTHEENYLSSNEGKHLPVLHCIKGTVGWMLNQEVEQALSQKEYQVIDKPTFGSRELVDLLIDYDKKQKIERIDLIGLCTDICVVSNALLIKAAFPEIEIRVIESCCAGVSVESHQAALTTMKMCQIEIV